MKPASQVLKETQGDLKDMYLNTYTLTEDQAIDTMHEYAKMVLQDYDNWKAHKTPDLVQLYIKEKGL